MPFVRQCGVGPISGPSGPSVSGVIVCRGLHVLVLSFSGYLSHFSFSEKKKLGLVRCWPNAPSGCASGQSRRACDSGTICIRAPSEPLRAVAQPLPGPVPSHRPCASLRLRASAIGIRQLRSSFVAVTPHTHASARCSRQRRHIRSADVRVPFHRLPVAIDVWLALSRRLEAPCAAQNGADGPTGT